MKYIFAIFCPPLILLLYGRWLAVISNALLIALGAVAILIAPILFAVFWIMAIVHAWIRLSTQKPQRREEFYT